MTYPSVPQRPESSKVRWSRSQRFQLSAQGREAAHTFREAIVASRAEAGRRSFDQAQAQWASQLLLEPTDGLYLTELLAGPLTLAQLTAALDGCGPQGAAVKAGIERLVKVRMVEALPPPADR